jgi:hypothetical protein
MARGEHARGDDNGARRKRERMPRGAQNGNAKLTSDQVDAIRTRLALGDRQADIAADFGVARQTIWNIAHGNTWKSSVDKRAILEAFKTTGEIVPGVEVTHAQRLDIR